MKMHRWLIVRADGSCRVVKTPKYKGQPNLRYDEVGFKLTIDFPKTWGEVAGEINLEVPGGDTKVEVEETVIPEQEAPAL